MLYGARAVMGLRKSPGVAGSYTLVEPVYVHGSMEREALRISEEGLLAELKFNIV